MLATAAGAQFLGGGHSTTARFRHSVPKAISLLLEVNENVLENRYFWKQENSMTKGLFDLSGKVTVVTGGNSGLGLAFARGIAKQGGSPAIWARNEDKNAAAKKELESFGVRVATHKVDVASVQEIVASYGDALKAFGRVDCVFANAGLAPPQTRSMLDLQAVLCR
jgi:hypothetical protein